MAMLIKTVKISAIASPLKGRRWNRSAMNSELISITTAKLVYLIALNASKRKSKKLIKSDWEKSRTSTNRSHRR